MEGDVFDFDSAVGVFSLADGDAFRLAAPFLLLDLLLLGGRPAGFLFDDESLLSSEDASFRGDCRTVEGAMTVFLSIVGHRVRGVGHDWNDRCNGNVTTRRHGENDEQKRGLRQGTIKAPLRTDKREAKAGKSDRRSKVEKREQRGVVTMSCGRFLLPTFGAKCKQGVSAERHGHVLYPWTKDEVELYLIARFRAKHPHFYAFFRDDEAWTTTMTMTREHEEF